MVKKTAKRLFHNVYVLFVLWRVSESFLAFTFALCDEERRPVAELTRKSIVFCSTCTMLS